MIWLEILSRHHDVISRQRVDVAGGKQIRIGRAYDCDVVLDDAYVAPHHLSLALNETNQWTALDENTVNGVFVEHATEQINRRKTVKTKVGSALVLGDDDIIRNH